MAGSEYFCKNENDLFFLYKTRRLSQWLYTVISIDDIKDKESLEAWLNDQPEAVRQKCAVFIAARSALRVLPIAVDGYQFSDWSRNSDFTSIPIWRSLITSTVAAIMPTDDLSKVAVSVASNTSFISAASDAHAVELSAASATIAVVAA